MDQGSFLHSKPISEVVISQVEECFLPQITWYLGSLGCHVKYYGERGKYHIQFPEGTVEAVYAGKSTQFTYRTAVILPNGTHLTKLVIAPCHPSYPPCNALAFPVDVLFGSEPQQITSIRPG